jgi:uncharacterized protein
VKRLMFVTSGIIALSSAVLCRSAFSSLPNPASAHCHNLEGTTHILQRASDGAQVGFCRFTDSSNPHLSALFEEWTLKNYSSTNKLKAILHFNHTPWPHTVGTRPGGHPALTYCLSLGGQRVDYKDKQGNMLGGCRFKDGSEIEEWTLFRGPHAYTGVPAL